MLTLMKITMYLYLFALIFLPVVAYGQDTVSATVVAHIASEEVSATQETVETPPALPGLASPDFTPSAPARLLDPTFAKHLEEQADYQSAILEWRRVAFTTEDNALKARAYFHIGRLYYLTDQPQKAVSAFENFAAHFPQDVRTEQALYYMVLSSIDLGSKEVPALIKTMEARFATSDWTKTARYQHLWHLAMQGEEKTFHAKTKQEQQLLQSLKAYPTDVSDKAFMATMLSFIPGAGHLYLGSLSIALAAFVVNLIFFMAFIHALRAKQWAYSMVLGLVFSCIYFGTMFSSYTLTYTTALSARHDAMLSWENMQPQTPKDTL